MATNVFTLKEFLTSGEIKNVDRYQAYNSVLKQLTSEDYLSSILGVGTQVRIWFRADGSTYYRPTI